MIKQANKEANNNVGLRCQDYKEAAATCGEVSAGA